MMQPRMTTGISPVAPVRRRDPRRMHTSQDSTSVRDRDSCSCVLVSDAFRLATGARQALLSVGLEA
jgi:hypothetical protein